MCEPQYTPGSWKSHKKYIWSEVEVAGKRYETSIGEAHQGFLALNEVCANARLMAAAPDLLAACKAAAQLIEARADQIDEECGASGCMCTMPGNKPHSDDLRENELAMCRAAIAKAEDTDGH